MVCIILHPTGLHETPSERSPGVFSCAITNHALGKGFATTAKLSPVFSPDFLVRHRDTRCLVGMWVSGAELLDNGFELSDSLVFRHRLVNSALQKKAWDAKSLF